MLRYHIIFTQKRSILEHKISMFQFFKQINLINPYINSTLKYKINSKNKRVLLKSPFHYKLVKFNTITPYFSYQIHLYFYSSITPIYIYKFFKKLSIYCFSIKLNYTYL